MNLFCNRFPTKYPQDKTPAGVDGLFLLIYTAEPIPPAAAIQTAMITNELPLLSLSVDDAGFVAAGAVVGAFVSAGLPDEAGTNVAGVVAESDSAGCFVGVAAVGIKE